MITVHDLKLYDDDAVSKKALLSSNMIDFHPFKRENKLTPWLQPSTAPDTRELQ